MRCTTNSWAIHVPARVGQRAHNRSPTNCCRTPPGDCKIPTRGAAGRSRRDFKADGNVSVGSTTPTGRRTLFASIAKGRPRKKGGFSLNTRVSDPTAAAICDSGSADFNESIISPRASGTLAEQPARNRHSGRATQTFRAPHKIARPYPGLLTVCSRGSARLVPGETRFRATQSRVFGMFDLI